MAKSLRSKRRRKMRAIKRERYGVKELERLKKTVGHEDIKKEVDAVMTDVSDIVTITDKNTINEKSKSKQTEDDSNAKPKNNLKGLRNEHGTYPVWIKHRQIRKNKKSKKNKSKRK